MLFLERLFFVADLQHTPQQTHHPKPSALPSSQLFREERLLPRHMRKILGNCSGGRCTCVQSKRPHRADLLRALCNICLDKLTTLSLRDIPPLNPFERREHLSDIHADCGRKQGPLLLTFIRHARGFRPDTRPAPADIHSIYTRGYNPNIMYPPCSSVDIVWF